MAEFDNREVYLQNQINDLKVKLEQQTRRINKIWNFIESKGIVKE